MEGGKRCREEAVCCICERYRRIDIFMISLVQQECQAGNIEAVGLVGYLSWGVSEKGEGPYWGRKYHFSEQQKLDYALRNSL